MLSIEALQEYDTPEARNSLFNALMGSPHLAGILSNGYNYPQPYDSSHILALAFGKDEQTLYTYNGSHQILHWIVQKHTYQPITIPVNLKAETQFDLAFSPNNHTLGIVSNDGIWLVDLQTHTARPSLAPPLAGIPATIPLSAAIAFSHDGGLVAASRCDSYPHFAPDQSPPPCAESKISIWSTQNGQEARSSFTINMDTLGLAFSSDGTQLAIASPTTIIVVDIATGHQKTLPRMSMDIISIAFSPNDRKLAAGSQDGTIHIWDTSTGESLSVFSGHKGPVESIAFSHNGDILASASQDGTIRLWQVSTGIEMAGSPLIGHPDQVFSIAFSPNDAMLASGGKDGSLMIWDMNAEGTINRRLADVRGAHNVLLSRDGKIILGTDDGKLLLLDSNRGELQETLREMTAYPVSPLSDVSPSAITSITLSGNNKILAAGRADGTILLWNWQTKTLMRPSPLKYRGHLTKVVLSDDGNLLAAGGDGPAVMIWNLNMPGNVSVFSVNAARHTGAAIALSNDGKLLAAGNCATQQAGNCSKSEVLVWAVGTKQPPTHLFTDHQRPFLDLTFNPDGSILAVSSFDGIRLWDTTKHTTTTLTVDSSISQPDLYYRTLHFSLDGKLLLSSNEFGDTTFTFVLWDVLHSEQFVQPFSESSSADGSIDIQHGSLAFSPDSQHLVSVFTRDHTNILLLWDITISAWERRGCDIAHRNLAPNEWKQLVKDEQSPTRICTNFRLDT